jgi:putative membrane protein
VLASAINPWAFSFEPLQLAPIAVLAFAYARRVHTLARRGRPVAAAKQAWFYTGIALLLVAVASPIDELGEQHLFWLHMSQHLLLGDLAPLAIVLGLNGPVLRPLLALPLIQRLRVLAHPLVALPLWTINLYVWHVPAVYQAALTHPAIHALQHLLFFAAGALMWAAVVEPLPGPAWFGTGWRALYVLFVRAAGGVLAQVFIWSGQALYPAYRVGERQWGIAPLTDQRLGGAVMFIEGAIVTLVAFCGLFLRWMREAELRQRLVDVGHDPYASARAARYGRSALARRGANQPPI